MPRPVFGEKRRRRPTKVETPPPREMRNLDITQFGHTLADYDEAEVALARAMFEAWNDERGLQRRFIEASHVTWFTLSEKDRVLWAAAARGAREYNDRTATMDDATYNAILTEASSI